MIPRLLGAFALLACLGSCHSTIEHSNLIAPRDGAGSVVTSTAGLEWYSSKFHTGAAPRANVSDYVCYSGPTSNFPPISQWASFHDMWVVQKQFALNISGDSTNEISNMNNAIKNISTLAKVDARVILAVIIHESFGNVRVPCTYSFGGVHNCGLMQSYNSLDTAYDPQHSLESITQMIIDGTQGTAAGPGLVQLFNDAPDTNRETGGNAFAVFRAYNSGSVNAENLSDGLGALASYVSDMANYLQGWNGLGSGSVNCNFASNGTTSTPTSLPTPSTCASTAFVPAPTQTVTGTTGNCCTWYTVQSGDSCYTIDQAYGITLDRFRAWNTYVDVNCDNLWVDYAYCVNAGNSTSSAATSVIATSTTGSTSVPSSLTTATCVAQSFVPAPTQTVTGTTSDCCVWYVTKSGDYCDLIDATFGITLDQFLAWNTYVNADCTNLWPAYAYCVDSSVVIDGSSTSSSAIVTPTTTSTTLPRRRR